MGPDLQNWKMYLQLNELHCCSNLLKWCCGSEQLEMSWRWLHLQLRLHLLSTPLEVSTALKIGISCPSWQWHGTGCRRSPVRTLPVAPLWCDLGFCSRTVVVMKINNKQLITCKIAVIDRKLCCCSSSIQFAQAWFKELLRFSHKISPVAPSSH